MMQTRFARHAIFGAMLTAAVTLAGTVQAFGVAGQGTWETTLRPRDLDGERGIDAYYDRKLNVTWLRNANVNGEMSSWDAARAWASNFAVGGFTDWRLPAMIDTGAPGCDIAWFGTDCGHNVQTKSGGTVYSEMAHLFFETLGNSGYYDRFGARIPDGGLTNTGPFYRLKGANYALVIDYPSGEEGQGRFATFGGFQDFVGGGLAMAVHPGDVGAIPEPQTLALMLAGLAGLALSVRRGAERRGGPKERGRP